MKIAFLRNAHRREHMLCDALRRGMARHKDRLEIVEYNDQPRELDCDAIGFAGVKCREWHQFCKETGKPFLYFDKGYFYPKEKDYSARMKILNCWRVAVNTNQPLEYLSAERHSMKRWDGFGPRPKPWREPTSDGHIIIAGSSPKFHLFHGLPDPAAWAIAVVEELRRHTDRPIHYRPKPSWWVGNPDQALPIEGTVFVPDGTFEERAAGAHAVVTFGSNAALIGMLSGVPSVVLGNGVMQLISSTSLSEIEDPRLASEEDRLQLLANLAHSQFTLGEMANGEVWGDIKTRFFQ